MTLSSKSVRGYGVGTKGSRKGKVLQTRGKIVFWGLGGKGGGGGNKFGEFDG